MEKTIRWWLRGIAAVGLLAVGVYIGWFAWHLGKGLSDDPAVWGQFGDYLGGFLNPLIAAAAFYWLTRSVRIQEREIAEATKAMAQASAAQAAATSELSRLVAVSADAAKLSALSAKLQSVDADIAHLRETQRFIAERGADATKSTLIILPNGEAIRSADVSRQLNEMERHMVKFVAERDKVKRAIVGDAG